MSKDAISQAQAFWNKVKAADWSDEQTRSQIRREAGVVQHGLDSIFSDGSALRDGSVPLEQRWFVRESRNAAAAGRA